MKTNHDIHQSIIMQPNTYFGYVVAGTYILVVKDQDETKVYRSSGAPIERLALLDHLGFKIVKFEKAN